MAILLDRCQRKRGATRPVSEEPKQILPDVANRVEAGYLEWQDDCSFCNSKKGPNLSGLDPVTGRLVPLFNPRRQRWHRHFHWVGPILIGRTQTGRATVTVLDINDPARVEMRQELIDLDEWPAD